MSWEERMAERARARRPQAEGGDRPMTQRERGLQLTTDGAIIYPPPCVLCTKCGWESHYSPEINDARRGYLHHECSGSFDAPIACACCATGLTCCVSKYVRRERFLHQRLANVLRAKVEE